MRVAAAIARLTVPAVIAVAGMLLLRPLWLPAAPRVPHLEGTPTDGVPSDARETRTPFFGVRADQRTAYPLSASPGADVEVRAVSGAEAVEDPVEVERQQTQERVIDRFEAQPRADGWARPMEREIQDQVAQYAEAHDISGVLIGDVECKTNRCRLEMLYSDGPTAARLQARLFDHSVIDVEGCRLRSIGMTDVPEGGTSQVLYLLCFASEP